MKISVLKVSRKKEVIKRLELSEIAEMIRENPEKIENHVIHFKQFALTLKNSQGFLLIHQSAINIVEQLA